MSFSSDVKKELIAVENETRHCKIAEIGAFLLMTGKIRNENNQHSMEMHTENELIATKYFTMLEKTFNISKEVMSIKPHNKLRKGYVVEVNGSDESEKILLATSILSSETKSLGESMAFLTVQSICCKRAYLRGAFLGGGSVSDPAKAYHLEFVTQKEIQAQFLQEMMKSLEMDAKIVLRKGHYVVYLKEGSQIVDLLNVMGAHLALMAFENIRIVKEVRNNVNRLVNCETANLKKTVSAAVRQVQDIEYIRDTMGLATLPGALEQIARYRLEYSSATLKELGELLDPPVGKSGVNHRLKKLSEIANEIREQRGGVTR